MAHTLTLKPIGDNAEAGATAVTGATVEAIGPADLIMRLLPTLTTDELQRVRLAAEARLRERSRKAR